MVTKEKKTDPQIKARIPQSLVDRINDFRHANKLETKNDAIERLLELGLTAAGGASGNLGESPSNNNDEDTSHVRPA